MLLLAPEANVVVNDKSYQHKKYPSEIIASKHSNKRLDECLVLLNHSSERIQFMRIESTFAYEFTHLFTFRLETKEIFCLLLLNVKYNWIKFMEVCMERLKYTPTTAMV